MKSDYYFNRNQLLSLASLMLLSPALRLFPNTAAEYASQAAALSSAAAVPFLLLYIYFICRFMDKRQEGEGIAELFIRCTGPKAGRLLLSLMSLWLLLYAAFILRAGADRIICNIYPYSRPGLFIAVMALISTLAAMGAARSIVRAAKIFLPFILGMIIFILFFSMFSVSKENLLSISFRDSLPVMKSSLGSADIFTVVLYLICFMAPFVHKTANSFRAYSIWLFLMTALISLLCIAVVGSFGAQLTVKLAWPFFSLVRNLVFFNSLERIEALVVSIWVFPDFLLVSSLLYAAQYSIRLICGESSPGYKGERMFSTNNKRLIIPLCGLFCLIGGLLIAKDPIELEFWSNKLIPVINLLIALAFIPGVYAYGKIKKKL